MVAKEDTQKTEDDANENKNAKGDKYYFTNYPITNDEV